MRLPEFKNEDGYYGGGPVTIILWVLAIALVIWLLSALF